MLPEKTQYSGAEVEGVPFQLVLFSKMEVARGYSQDIPKAVILA
jgi:hypothetical protein